MGDILAVSQFTLYASVKKGNHGPHGAGQRQGDFPAALCALSKSWQSSLGQAGADRCVWRRYAGQP